MRYNKRGKEAPKDFTLPKPNGMDKMFEFAKILSKGIPFVRVDFYYVNGKIYFGELTFYHGGGFSLVRPDEWNVKLGEWIDLARS